MDGDSRAAVTAPGGSARSAEDDALEALRLDWGGSYMIGYDDDRGWWAARHGRIGHIITEAGPDELRAAVAADHGPART